MVPARPGQAPRAPGDHQCQPGFGAAIDLAAPRGELLLVLNSDIVTSRGGCTAARPARCAAERRRRHADARGPRRRRARRRTEVGWHHLGRRHGGPDSRGSGSRTNSAGPARLRRRLLIRSVFKRRRWVRRIWPAATRTSTWRSSCGRGGRLYPPSRAVSPARWVERRHQGDRSDAVQWTIFRQRHAAHRRLPCRPRQWLTARPVTADRARHRRQRPNSDRSGDLAWRRCRTPPCFPMPRSRCSVPPPPPPTVLPLRRGVAVRSGDRRRSDAGGFCGAAAHFRRCSSAATPTSRLCADRSDVTAGDPLSVMSRRSHRRDSAPRRPVASQRRPGVVGAERR